MINSLKVLFFVDRLRGGGIQILIRDILKYNDNMRMKIDVVTLDDGIVYPLKNDLESLGTSIYQIHAWLDMSKPWSAFKYHREAKKFFQEHHDYDVVHMHSSSKNFLILKYASLWGIPVRVAHSHNTGFQSHNLATVAIGNLMKSSLIKYSTHLCGCSKVACDWLFGKESVEEGRASVILNGIHTQDFVFDADKRSLIRKEFDLEDKFVVGHVGRFVRQKNHTYLIDIFNEVQKIRTNARLMLIGVGELMDEMKAKVEQYGIEDKVLFMGFRNDRNELMQAMDTFCFPSLYEGLSVVLIEAQASGMPVFASDSTTQETAYSPNMHFLSLHQSPAEWAKAVIGQEAVEREDMTVKIRQAGFDIDVMIDNFYKLYRSKQS